MLLAVAVSSTCKWLKKTCLSSKRRATIYFHYCQMTVAPPRCNIDKESSFIRGSGRRRRRRWWIEGLTWRPDPSPQWGWTIIEGTHRGRELRSRWRIHGAERICWRCLTFFIFFIDSCLSRPHYRSGVFVRPAAQRTEGGRRRINTLFKALIAALQLSPYWMLIYGLICWALARGDS